MTESYKNINGGKRYEATLVASDITALGANLAGEIELETVGTDEVVTAVVIETTTVGAGTTTLTANLSDGSGNNQTDALVHDLQNAGKSVFGVQIADNFAPTHVELTATVETLDQVTGCEFKITRLTQII